ncbi:hypothetical protein [Candidatus Ichthyocystis sparus]|nr:hypothetical protein [Candidatus Ichthyocystis sparus]
MKRKLSSTSSGASGLEGNDERCGVDDGAQPSDVLELEQSTGSVDAGGFVLDPHLAQLLGMFPGEMLFRSMFYGTPQAPYISSLAAQLVDKHEALVRREIGEGTSSTVRPSDGGYNLALMAYNESAIRALLDSIEAPESAVVPSEVVEGLDTTHWQVPVPSVPEALEAADTMYWQAPSSPEEVAIGVVREEGLLGNQELERSGAVHERVRFDCGDTAVPTAAHADLMQALVASIELPSVTSVPVGVVDSEERSVEELEEEICREAEAIKLEGAKKAWRAMQEAKAEIERLKAERKAEKERLKEAEAIDLVVARELWKATQEAKARAAQEAKAEKERLKVERKAEKERLKEAEAIKLAVAREERRAGQRAEREAKARAVREAKEIAALERKANRERLRAAKKAWQKRSKAETLNLWEVEEAWGVAMQEEREERERWKEAEAIKLEEAREAWRVAQEAKIRAAQEAKARAALEREANRERLRAAKKAEQERLKKEREEEVERSSREEKERELELEKERAERVERSRARMMAERREREEREMAIREERARIERLKEEMRAKRESMGGVSAVVVKRGALPKALEDRARSSMQDTAETLGKVQEGKVVKDRYAMVEAAGISVPVEEERLAKVRRELEEEREVSTRIRDLELELERVIGLERYGEVVGGVRTATREEIESELHGVRVQEQNLNLELNRVRAHAMNLDGEMWLGGVISGATAAEIEAKKNRLRELSMGRARLRLRELELEIGLSRVRVRARGLVLELERLRAREQGRY